MENDLAVKTKSQLQTHLRDLGLKVSGNKPELIKRIQDYEASQSKYSKMNVKELKALLKERKLSTIGRKDELIERLTRSDKPSFGRILSPKVSPKKRVPPKPLPKIKIPLPQPIAKIPSEFLHEILLNLDDEELTNACKSHQRAANICRDDSFWYKRIKRKFDYDLKKYKDESATYRDMYIFLNKTKNKDPSSLIEDSINLGYLPIIKYFIEVLGVDKTDASLVDKTDATLVDNMVIIAAEADIDEKLDIVKYLIENANANPDMALIVASSTGNLPMVKYLIEEADANVNATGEFSFLYNYGLATPLIDAIYGLHYSVVNYLLENNADPTYYSNMPLIAAARKGSLSIAKELIKRGADVYAQKNEALVTADRFKHIPMIEYLEQQMGISRIPTKNLQ